MIIKLTLVVVTAISFVIPAAAIMNMNQQSAAAASTTVKVITTQQKTSTFTCKDPSGKKLFCILILKTQSPPPKHTVICKDNDNHKFKCSFIIVHKTLNHIVNKIVILTVYASPTEKSYLAHQGKTITIVVIKIVVKVIHEEDEHTHHITKIVVFREEDDADKPTVINIFCYTGCIQQELNYGVAKNTIISAPVTINNINQITNIVNNVNAINSNVNIAIAVANNGNVNNNVNVNSVPNPPPTTTMTTTKPTTPLKKPIIPPAKRDVVSLKKIYTPPALTGARNAITPSFNCHSPGYNGTCAPLPIRTTANKLCYPGSNYNGTCLPTIATGKTTLTLAKVIPPTAFPLIPQPKVLPSTPAGVIDCHSPNYNGTCPRTQSPMTNGSASMTNTNTNTSTTSPIISTPTPNNITGPSPATNSTTPNPTVAENSTASTSTSNPTAADNGTMSFNPRCPSNYCPPPFADNGTSSTSNPNPTTATTPTDNGTSTFSSGGMSEPNLGDTNRGAPQDNGTTSSSNPNPPSLNVVPNNDTGTPPPENSTQQPQTQTCPDGSVIDASATCPAAQPPQPTTQTCPDGSVIDATATCPPVQQQPQTQQCPDGSTIDASATCPNNSPPPTTDNIPSPPSTDNNNPPGDNGGNSDNSNNSP